MSEENPGRSMSPEDFGRVCLVLVAWQAGEITEGQASALTGLDRQGLREVLSTALGAARDMLALYRERHPYPLGFGDGEG
jgi:hypothetical protein